MQTITTIGLDIAKSVFQVHGVDTDGKVVRIRRQLKRRYVLAFFEESCGPAWSASRPVPRHTIGHASCRPLGPTVRLMPPSLRQALRQTAEERCGRTQRPSVRQVTRTNMRFVPVKTPGNEQQSGLMLHRTRHLFIRQQTSLINTIRAHLARGWRHHQRSGAPKASRNYCGSSPIRATNGCLPNVVQRACLAATTGQPNCSVSKADLPGF